MHMEHRFLLTDRANGALDPAAALDFVSDPGFGGITMFVGKVRDLNGPSGSRSSCG
jgi:molybdopterin synthase catalytic subunit